jgi:GT2 family glycosyltransferase
MKCAMRIQAPRLPGVVRICSGCVTFAAVSGPGGGAMARVSVIVPAFNAAATIVQTLESVVAQSYQDWEIVVGDDHSTDATAELARSVSPRVTVVTAEVNGGPAAARNLAVAHATGELMALLDADDRWLPTYLISQVAAFDRAQGAGGAGGAGRAGEVGVVACDAYLEDPSGARLPGTYRARVPVPAAVTVETLLEGNPIFVSALTRTQLVRDAGGFDPATFGSEDHDLWCKLVEQGYRVVDNPVPLAVYLLADASVSSQRAGMAHTNQATYRLALARGRLTPAQRRLARRQLRLHQGVETVERYLADRDARTSPRSLVRLAGGLAALAVFAVEHPRRWPRWLGSLARGRAAVWRRSVRD